MPDVESGIPRRRKHPKPKPSAAGSVWRGGARERARNARQGVPRRSGLCADESRMLTINLNDVEKELNIR